MSGQSKMFRPLLILVTLFAPTMVRSQVIQPESVLVVTLEGNQSKVLVYSDDMRRIHVLGPSSRELCVQDCWGLPSVSVDHRMFLKLTFDTGHGTGINRERTVLVCVSSDSIFVALDIESYYRSTEPHLGNQGSDTVADNEFYDANIAILSDSLPLSARVEERYGEYYSIAKSKQNRMRDDLDSACVYDSTATTELKFDPRDRVWYNEVDTVDATIGIVKFEAPDTTVATRFNKESYRGVKLRFGGSYAHIRHVWHLGGVRDEVLYELSGPCPNGDSTVR